MSFLLLALNYGRVNAQAIACNNSVQVSVDGTPNVCQAVITADMILEGDPVPGRDYEIEIKYSLTVIASGVNEATITGASQYFGANLTAKITDLTTGNSCWGNMHLEDKLPPVLTCPDVTVSCSENLNTIAAPSAEDNCDLSPDVQLNGETILTANICTNGYALIERTYVGVDDEGNVSPACVQKIYVERPTAVDFPNDIIWDCEQYDAYPGITTATKLHPSITDTDPSTPNVIDVSKTLSTTLLNNTGSGNVHNVTGTYCNYQVSHNDQVLTNCGSSFKIIRTWTVLDWCTNSVVTSGVNGEDNVQIIKVVDDESPLVVRPPFNVSANVPGQHPQPCRSQGYLQPPTELSDNCNVVDLKIYTPVGEAIYLNGGGLIPPPGLPIGTHNVTYQATDACGNQTNLIVEVTVVDDVVPISVCDEITDVNLGSDGQSLVPASVFDDGSYDNCCLDKFEVRRMEDNCDDGHDDTVFGPTIVFCCEDLTASPVTVVFRVLDCDGNHNECMVQVNVNDKIEPVLTNCPPNQRVTCDWYADNLELQLEDAETEEEECDLLSGYFGTAQFHDNCNLVTACDVFVDIDQCLEGVIRRTWAAQDEATPPNQASQVCVQRIFVDHVSDWVVEFPADLSVECGTTVPEFGEPEIFYETCELVAVSYEDEIFNVVPDACYKIVREWTIINWCVVGDHIDQEVSEDPENALGLTFPACDLDGDGDCDDRTFRDSWNNIYKPNANQATQVQDPDTDPDSDPWDGYIIYEQVIKVTDEVDPVFTDNCQIDSVCIGGNTCGVDLELPLPLIDECSPDVNVTVEIKFGNTWYEGFGPHENVPPGTYEVRYVAEDNCNNQSACETTVTVEDCKLPTPYCKNGLIVELMVPVDPNDDAMVPVWASDFNAGSFDNCPGTLTFSFSALESDDSKVYTCNEVGQQPVQMWVTDAAGNQDFCETFVEIQANMGQCGDDPMVATSGIIQNENNDAVEDVEVSLTGQSTGSVMSDSDGAFQFAGIPVGNDITITPEKNDGPLNGVTTFDLLLISKHVLGTQVLDSPYRIIAADANNSGTVTTADIVELRRLILQITTAFSNNTSWRFVDKDYGFPNPENPWEEIFPEVININNIPASAPDADFVAVKIGDVNGSAATNLASSGGDERNQQGAFTLTADDKKLEAGQFYTVTFEAADPEVVAYQFTLNFDRNMIEFTELVPGLARSEHFGLTLLDQGAITVSWNQTSTGSMQLTSEQFALTFKAKQTGKLSDMLHVNSRYTLAEAYKTGGSAMGVELTFSGESTDRFELYQNTPNPFTDETVIGFHMPEAGKAKLTLTDVSGKTLRAFENEFAGGYNEVRINRNDLPSFGVIYYTLETASETATKKMIVLK